MAATSPRSDDDARRAASLRRVAIVLKDLPRSVATKLIGELPVEAQQRLQYEVSSLADIDPLERKRALETFAGSMRRSATTEPIGAATSNSGDELVFSRAATRHTNTNQNPSGYPNPSKNPAESIPTKPDAFGFLASLSDDDVRGILQDEHPQTIAVVMASIEPARAAAMLPAFPPRQRQDILSRIGRLQELPETMIEDLVGTFRKRAEALMSRKQANPLQDLINAYAPVEGWDPAQASRHVPTDAVAVSPRLRAILAELPDPTTQRNDPSTQTTANASQTASRVPASNVRIHSPRESDSADADPSPTSLPVELPSQSNESSFSTDEVHQRLIAMKPRQLCEALGRVPTRTAMLALCGLPNKTADAAINVLPRAKANEVRLQLANVGSMELREIDDAKESILVSATQDVSPTAKAA